MIPKRTKGKTNRDYGTREAYERFLEKHPEFKDKVSAKMHLSILRQFHSLLRKRMIEEAYIYSMPGIGAIAVRRRKIRVRFEEDGRLRTYNLPVDYNETRKLWDRDLIAAKKKQLVFFLNDHTNGWRYTWHWHRTGKDNLSLYKFIPCRRLKRELAAALKDVYKRLSYFGA